MQANYTSKGRSKAVRGERVLDENRIKEILAAANEPVKLVFYDSTDSTNNRAKEWAKNGCAGECVAFLAREQTAGRGRRGRSFLSQRGGIYTSLLFYPDDSIEIQKITAEAAAAAALAIEDCTGLSVDIKWVNDLYVNEKKLAGILTEGEFDENGKLSYCVLGLGINVYKIEDFSEKMPIATTLEDEICRAKDTSENKKTELDINEIFVSVLSALIKFFDKKKPSDKKESALLLAEYRKRCFVIGKNVLFRRGNDEFFATVKGVNSDYSLSVLLPSGEEISLNSGEVSTVIK